MHFPGWRIKIPSKIACYCEVPAREKESLRVCVKMSYLLSRPLIIQWMVLRRLPVLYARIYMHAVGVRSSSRPRRNEVGRAWTGIPEPGLSLSRPATPDPRPLNHPPRASPQFRFVFSSALALLSLSLFSSSSSSSSACVCARYPFISSSSARWLFRQLRTRTTHNRLARSLARAPSVGKRFCPAFAIFFPRPFSRLLIAHRSPPPPLVASIYSPFCVRLLYEPRLRRV